MRNAFQVHTLIQPNMPKEVSQKIAHHVLGGG